jgi:hypothetical protein
VVGFSADGGETPPLLCGLRAIQTEWEPLQVMALATVFGYVRRE